MKPRDYWTFEKLKETASKFKTKLEFRQAYDGGYQMAIRKKWLDKICSHMTPLNSKLHRDVYIIFSKVEKCAYVGLSTDVKKRIALHLSKPSKKVEQLLNNPYKIVILKRHLITLEAVKWEEIYYSELIKRGYQLANTAKTGSIGNLQTIKWTKENVQKVALQFQKSIDFYQAYPGAYDAAQRKGWLDEVTSHINKNNRSKKYEINNKFHTVTEICKLANLPRTTIFKRILRGITGEELLKPKMRNQYN
jgi:predicted GIY-YIG superfamily endonuclease